MTMPKPQNEGRGGEGMEQEGRGGERARVYVVEEADMSAIPTISRAAAIKMRRRAVGLVSGGHGLQVSG